MLTEWSLYDDENVCTFYPEHGEMEDGICMACYSIDRHNEDRND